MKILYITVFLSILYLIIGYNTNEEIRIPSEALRFRVIANSNTEEDQRLKLKVKEDVEKNLGTLLNNIDDYKEAYTAISDNINIIDRTVKQVLEKEKSIIKYNINLGSNYFPAKEYYGIKYDEGDYQSLVITLGEGLGDNWWCVLFPPLCLIETEGKNEVEYRVYVKDILDKFL